MKKQYESVLLTILEHTGKDVFLASPDDGIGIQWSDNWTMGGGGN